MGAGYGVVQEADGGRYWESLGITSLCNIQALTYCRSDTGYPQHFSVTYGRFHERGWVAKLGYINVKYGWKPGDTNTEDQF